MKSDRGTTHLEKRQSYFIQSAASKDILHLRRSLISLRGDQHELRTVRKEG